LQATTTARSLQWTVFDGGLRKNRLAQARSDAKAAEAQAQAARDQIADEVWSALESYNYSVRNLLDVTAAQRTLAQARSADVLARTQVLTALANLAFRAGDAIQPEQVRPVP
jgi:outer membrane protein